MKHLYILEIVDEDKEIIITKTEKLLWNLIPHSPEMFEQVLINFPDYKVFELEENFLRLQADRVSIMNPN